MRPLVFDFGLEETPVSDAEVLDFRTLTGVSRYCSCESELIMAGMIAGHYCGLHFLGSGDYHYLTKILTDSIPMSFDLLLLDNHPDMQTPAFGDVLSCGGWVRTMLENNSKLGQVTIVGINPTLMEETVGYPERVTVFPDAGSVVRHESDKPLYISIDKDVLSPKFASTNWDQGSMSLDEMESVLEVLGSGREILGVDICGSFPSSEGGTPQDANLNSIADKRIAAVVSKLLQVKRKN